VLGWTFKADESTIAIEMDSTTDEETCGKRLLHKIVRMEDLARGACPGVRVFIGIRTTGSGVLAFLWVITVIVSVAS
jgi:hypothetical protein